MERITVTIPSNPLHVSTIRLMISSIASHIGFDVEAIEDLRVCVSEALNFFLDTHEEVTVFFDMEPDNLTVCVRTPGFYNDVEANQTLQLSRLILDSLMDEVSLDEKGLQFIKRLKVT